MKLSSCKRDSFAKQLVVNESANKYFIGNAQLLKRLETVQASLAQNTKIVVPANQELVNVVGDMAGILPVKRGNAAAGSR